MRYFYFFILLIILTVSAAGLAILSRQQLDFYHQAISANLNANLIATQLDKAERLIKFSEAKPISILFVGDIMLDRGVRYQIEKNNDFRYPFLKTAEFLRSADLTFGNLEGTISERGTKRGPDCCSFRADPRVIEGLKFAGFDVLTLANNHIWDWSKEALEDTLFVLKENNIKPVGAGENCLEANQPAIYKISLFPQVGLVDTEVGNPETAEVKIAFLAYTNLFPEILTKAGKDSPGISSFKLEEIGNEIRRLKENKLADIVIVGLHWGIEYQEHSNSVQQKIGYSLIEAGADLIVGSHPHLAQEIEKYQNGWLVYSLGNFVFDQNFSQKTREGLAVKAVIVNKKIEKIEPFKIKISETFQPELVGI